MLLLDDEFAYKQAWAYKDIGRSYNAVFNQTHVEGFRWLTETPGSNYRMTEFQAAIGLKQLEKLPRWVAQRNKNAEEIIGILKQFDFIDTPTFQTSADNRHAYYRLYAKLKKDAVINGLVGEKLRNHIVNQLVLSGVPCFFGSCAEIYREKLFAKISPNQRLPNAADFADNAFCFLVHHTITNEQLQLMTNTIKQVLTDLDKR